MTQPLEEVFVEISPDTRDFSRELDRDTSAAYRKLEKSTTKVTENVERSFIKMGDKIEQSFDEVTRANALTMKSVEKLSGNAADDVADSFERAGERIEDAFKEASRVARRESRQIERAARDAGDNVTTSMSGIQRAASKAGETIVSLGAALVGLGASATTPAGLIAIAAEIAGIVGLIPIVLTLGAALADLIGLVGVAPAALGALTVSIAAVSIAFIGFGDAIEAIISKDPDKITEALKRLSPAAREVARDFQRALPAFERLQRAVQQQFFRPFSNTIDKLVKNLLPSLQRGLAQVAGAAGRQVNNLFDLFNQPKNIAVINRLFAVTAKLIDTIGPAFARFVDAILTVTGAGLPFLTRFGNAISDVVNRFAVFIEQSTKTGAFNDFVEDAISTLKDLIALTGALGNLLIAIFADADDEGRTFIQSLTTEINKLAEFFRTQEGKDFLQDLADGAKAAADVIATLFTLIAKISAFLGGVDENIAKFSADIRDFFNDIGQFFTDIGTAIGEKVDEIVSFFQALPGRIIAFLSTLPGLIVAFFNHVFDEATRAIGRGIGLMLFSIMQLPQLIINGLQSLPGLLVSLLQNTWQRARDTTVQGGTSIVDFVKQLSGRIANSIKGVGPVIANAFKSALDSAKSFVVNGFNAIVKFINEVPGRIKKAFAAAGSFLADIAGSIAGSIKSFLNRAIDKINQGIADVDNFLPGSLPRIPRLAKGGVIDPTANGTLAVLGEAGEREIATPESLLREIIGEMSQGVTFGPGSVVVSFEGVTPTESEARRTGQAVGMGILDIISQRDVRTRVRAL